MAGMAATPLAVRTEDDPPEFVQMQASYAVILRRSALATAPAAAVMIVLSGIVGGGRGLVGALLGVGLVIVFFGIDALALSWAARHSPQAMMVTAISAYLVKILALLFLVAKYSGTTAFNGKLFGFTVIACVLVWTTAQVLVSARLKVPYVEPDGKQFKVPYVEPDGKR
jgi:ATP synthase protein I